MLTRVISLFPAWALLFSLLAYARPDLFVGAKPMIVPLLGVVMFGMGMTLTWDSFAAVLRRPATVGLGVALQYLVMPLLAWAISLLLGLPAHLMAGMVLVGACPGGTASNVVCYLARVPAPTLASVARWQAAQTPAGGVRRYAVCAPQTPSASTTRPVDRRPVRRCRWPAPGQAPEDFRGGLLTFLDHEGVAPNNHAERQMRKPVVARRLCQQNPSQQGAKTYAILLSLFRTAELQGQQPVDFVISLTKAEIAGRSIDIGQGHRMGIGPIIGLARSLDRAQDSESNGIEQRKQSESGTCCAANGPKRKCSSPCHSTRESFLANVEENCS